MKANYKDIRLPCMLLYSGTSHRQIMSSDCGRVEWATGVGRVMMTASADVGISGITCLLMIRNDHEPS